MNLNSLTTGQLLPPSDANRPASPFLNSIIHLELLSKLKEQTHNIK